MGKMNVKNLNMRRTHFRTTERKFYDTIHNVHPYTAKLIPEIPRYLLKKYSGKNDTILDFCCGSGTTLLEAVLLKKTAVGIDINPLAVLISKVKTKPMDIPELELGIQRIRYGLKNKCEYPPMNFPNIDYWFCERAKNELSAVRCNLDKLRNTLTSDAHDFLVACFCSIIRKSSFADRYMAKTYKSAIMVRKIEAGWVPQPFRLFDEALDRNFNRAKLLSNICSDNRQTKVFQGDAKNTSEILRRGRVKEVDMIISSPPYINAQDYFRSYKLELFWSGLATPEKVKELDKMALGTERVPSHTFDSIPKSESLLLNRILHNIGKSKGKKNRRKTLIVHNYFENVRTVFRDLSNVLKAGGKLCLITGNNTICGVNIPTYKILTETAEECGFKLVDRYKDEITKRSLFLGRNHTGGVIKEEWINVFQL
jgi:DNA modification methylase